MDAVIQAQAVSKRFANKQALDNINLRIEPGRVVGLIGPNGAGKTTLLKGVLGLIPVEGQLEVLGKNPRRQRIELLQQISFIADTHTLPGWLTVAQALAYMEGVHPLFSRTKAEAFLAKTQIQTRSRVSQLSKGMITQLHLALIMAIDSRLLVLDEPTLGLDIIYRKAFYTSLLNDYYDKDKTILITTHQVEEIEAILTDLIFINQGRLLLDSPMEDLPERFVELHLPFNAAAEDQAKAQALAPIHSRSILGGHALIYDGVARAQLAELGQVTTPSVADLFVAMVNHAATQDAGAQQGVA
jgi:ABC-2 type transport system ATP-binding protein